MSEVSKNSGIRRMVNLRAMTHVRIMRLRTALLELCSKKRESSDTLGLLLPGRELSISDTLDLLCGIAEPKIKEMLK